MPRLGNPDWNTPSPYDDDVTTNEDEDLSPLDDDYIPEEYCIDNEWIEAHIAYAFDRKNVTCKASLKIKNTLVPLDRAKEWNKIARQFSQALSQQITLKKINL